MANVSDFNWSKAEDEYNAFMERNSDPRTKDWFLLHSPLPVLTITVIYLCFCLKLGPRMMKYRKPIGLRKTLIVYNMLNVVGSAWLFFELLQGGWMGDYSFRCQPVDYSNSPQALRMARAVWCYMIFKLIELMDTVFFVLRKKNNQVSHLHLYHHTVMPLGSWMAARFVPGGHGTFGGLANTFVHVVMYTYYLLAALGPKYQCYLWWKKHLTVLQMVQFTMALVHHGQLFFIECDYPMGMTVFFFCNSVYFMFLFATFYRDAYVRKAKTG